MGFLVVPCGVASTLAYPDVFEALVGRFRGD
jgi:hypothetical protein